MKKLITSTLLVFIIAFAFVAADDLSGSIASKSGDPGSSVTYDILYTNSGAADIVVSSTSTTLTDGTNTISAPSIGSVTVPAGSSATVSFSITIPSTPAGTYVGTISGTDVSNADNKETLPYTLTVNSKDSFTLSTSSISFDLQSDAKTETFTVSNTGSTTLSSLTINFTSSGGDFNKILDDNDDELSIDFSTSSTSLAPGSSVTISVTADPDSDFDFGTYSGTIYVAATGTSSISSSLSLSAEVASDICEEGRQGNDFEIDIRNPDDGDDFFPGEVIPMEVKIENQANDDLDVELEVTLYNMDTGDKEKVVRQEGSIDEDETETFTFDFALPTDLDEDDDYELFVQVHEDGNEEDSCDYESIEIGFDREDQAAVISQAGISPEIGLVCGDSYRASIEIQSTGSEEISDLYVEIRDADLDVQEESESFDLGDFDARDNQQKITFDLNLPKDIAEGTYSLEAILHDKNGNTLDSELINVDISSCSAEEAAGDLDLDISEDYDVEGNELTLNMIIKNTGDDEKTITLSVEDVSWAELEGTEYLNTLQASDEAHAYAYLTLDDTTEGKHDIKISVTDDQGNEVSEIVTVDFGETQEEDGFFANINNWFAERLSGGMWILVDIILIILAIVFIRMLFSKK